jgi:hypothetical protein
VLKTSTVSELRCPYQALINFHYVVYTVLKEKNSGLLTFANMKMKG